MPKFPFETISTDTCGPFPNSAQGNNYVLTVVDMFTGYIEFKCTATKSAKEVAEFLINEIIQVLQMCHIRTSPYNPAANGRCKHTHRVLKDCLTE